MAAIVRHLAELVAPRGRLMAGTTGTAMKTLASICGVQVGLWSSESSHAPSPALHRYLNTSYGGIQISWRGGFFHY